MRERTECWAVQGVLERRASAQGCSTTQEHEKVEERLESLVEWEVEPVDFRSFPRDSAGSEGLLEETSSLLSGCTHQG